MARRRFSGKGSCEDSDEPLAVVWHIVTAAFQRAGRFHSVQEAASPVSSFRSALTSIEDHESIVYKVTPDTVNGKQM